MRSGFFFLLWRGCTFIVVYKNKNKIRRSFCKIFFPLCDEVVRWVFTIDKPPKRDREKERERAASRVLSLLRCTLCLGDNESCCPRDIFKGTDAKFSFRVRETTFFGNNDAAHITAIFFLFVFFLSFFFFN